MKSCTVNIKKIIWYVVITEIIGFLGSMLGGDTSAVYKELIKPSLAPPSVVFPIVWSILYLFLGIAAGLVAENDKHEKALRLYWVQIVLNSLWTFFFFRLKWFTFSAIWITLLIVLTGYLIVRFFRVCKAAGWLIAPYLIWLFYALYLNIGFASLN